MATIDPRILGNPQLTGLLTSVPMPQVVTNGVAPFALAGAGGAYSSFSPSFAVSTGFNALAPAVVMPNATTGSGQIVVGSGSNYTAPVNGAQPQAPTAGTQPVATSGGVTPGVAGVAASGTGTAAATGAATGAAATGTATATNTSTPIITTTASGAAPSTGSALAKAESGFGAASRTEPIRASVDGASFGFPSFRASSKSNDAPGINWGPGWTRVEKDGLWYMQHSNGVRAVPAVEWRITPKPADKVQTIKVANGWGKRFPDGSVLVFDRTEGAYLLDPKGNKKPMSKGNHVIGGVKVRIFEATVVRTIDKDGKVDVFDSRGNRSTGTTRWNEAASVGSANAGAASIVAGGGAASTASAPGKVDAGGPPGKATGGGVTGVAADIQAATDLARQILGEIQGGSVDPARLQALVAQLNTLPAGLLQAMGAGGSLTGTGATTAVGGVNGPAAGTQVTGTTTTAGGGGTSPASTTTNSTPTPGRDANATTKQLDAGASAKADPAAIPAELHGKQARFGQLPDAVQQAVAKAFGSDQGSRAFTPDRLIAFAADGTVKVVDAGVVNLRHQVQVRGAGPGEDQVMTMRPGRQPKFGTSSSKPVSGGGASTNGVHASGGSHAVSGGGGIAAKKITLFAAGSETRHEDFGGLDGTYTFATLPAKAKAALLALLRTGDDAAAKAFGARTGSGWVIDPSASIVLGAGYATFPNGLTMARGAAAATSRPPVGIPTVTVTTTPSTARPTNQPEAHDATRPPVAGGGAAASGGGATPPAGGGTGAAPSNAPRPPMVMEPGMVHDHG